MATSIIFRLSFSVALVLLFSVEANCQPATDSMNVSLVSDDTAVAIITGDTSYLSISKELASFTSPYVVSSHRKYFSDFQFEQFRNPNEWIFIWLFVALLILTLFRNLFKNESEDFLGQVLNAINISSSSRSKSSSFSAFTFLLTTIFIVNASIVSSFFIKYFFSVVKFNALQLTLILIFLFTLFVMFKVAVVNTLGIIFDEDESAFFYTHDFMLLLQTFGISMFPVVVLAVVGSSNMIYYLLVALIIVVVSFVVYFIVRRLSTSVILMYKSLYHFLLYICVVEILSVFLFIKLLTKIAF